MRFEDSREYQMGQQSEEIFARKMQARGWAVIPTCDLSCVVKETKAPILYAPMEGLLVTPDAMVFRDGAVCWTEIKGKSEPTWRVYPPGPRWEHGIDHELLAEYEDVQRVTRLTVYVIVHELKSPLDPRRQSALIPSDLWLRLSMNKILSIGEHRPKWPGGVASPNRRGRGGRGGWLWARSAMTAITL